MSTRKGARCGRAPRRRRKCVRIERGGQPLGQVLHSTRSGACCAAPAARRGRRAGDRDRPPARRAAPSPGRGAGLAGADSRCWRRGTPADRTRPARRRPAALGLDRARAAARPTRPRTRRAGRCRRRWTGRSPRSPSRSTSCASWRAGCARRSSTPASGPRCGISRAGHRSRSRCDVRPTGALPTVETAAYFTACEGLTNAVKHAHATKVVLSAARHNGALVVSVVDNGVGGAVGARGLRPAAGSSIALPRRAARCASEAKPARHHSHRGVSMRVVIVEDQALLREGLARLFADGGHEVVGTLGSARAASADSRRAATRAGRHRHPNAADLHRRGRPRGARDQGAPPRHRRPRPLPTRRDHPRGDTRDARRVRLSAQGPGPRRRLTFSPPPRASPAVGPRSTRRSLPASSRTSTAARSCGCPSGSATFSS